MVCLLIGLSAPNCELKLLRSHSGWGFPRNHALWGTYRLRGGEILRRIKCVGAQTCPHQWCGLLLNAFVDLFHVWLGIVSHFKCIIPK